MAFSTAILHDLSDRERVGFRGRNAQSLLLAHTCPVPPQANQSIVCSNGDIVARLGQNEYWLLGAGGTENSCSQLFQLAELPQQDCYHLFCRDSHAWFMLAGDGIDELMKNICGVDLTQQKFPPGQVAQTLVAGLSAIVIRQTHEQLPCFHVLLDIASKHYFEATMNDLLQHRI